MPEGKKRLLEIIQAVRLNFVNFAAEYHRAFYRGLRARVDSIDGSSYRESGYIDSRLLDHDFNPNAAALLELLDDANGDVRNYRNRYQRDPRAKHKLTLRHIKAEHREAFYRLAKGIPAEEPLPEALQEFLRTEGARVAAIKAIEASDRDLADKQTAIKEWPLRNIINTLHVPWEYVIADADKYNDPNKRKEAILELQENGIVWGIAFLKNPNFFTPGMSGEEKLDKLMQYYYAGWSLDNGSDALAKRSYAEIITLEGQAAKDWHTMRSVIEQLGLEGSLADLVEAGNAKYPVPPVMARNEGDAVRVESKGPSALKAHLRRLIQRFMAPLQAMIRFLNTQRQAWRARRAEVAAAKVARATILSRLTSPPAVEGVSLPAATSPELGQVSDPETAREAAQQRAGLLAVWRAA